VADSRWKRSRQWVKPNLRPKLDSTEVKLWSVLIARVVGSEGMVWPSRGMGEGNGGALICAGWCSVV